MAQGFAHTKVKVSLRNHTIDYGNEAWAVSESTGGVDKNQPGNVDLMKLQKAAWGNLG